MILLAQDMLGETTRRTAAAGDRAARLMVEMNRNKLQIDSEVRPRLTNSVKPKLLARGDQLLKTADTELQTAETALGANNVTEAFSSRAVFLAEFARHGARLLDQRRGKARAGQQSLCRPVLPRCHRHFSLITSVESARRMANQLPEGNFEDLGRAINAGWKHYQHPPEGVREEAELSKDQYFEGKHSLRWPRRRLTPRRRQINSRLRPAGSRAHRSMSSLARYCGCMAACSFPRASKEARTAY